MPEFIVDTNLPFRIQKWQNDLFVHVLNINSLWNDDEIWDYAKTNNLIIITKDKDFRLKQIIHGFPPKIIHIKFWNLKLQEFENVINECWGPGGKINKNSFAHKYLSKYNRSN